MTTLTKKMSETSPSTCRDGYQGPATSTRRSARSRGSRYSGTCAPGSSTCWWASTSCGKAWTSRRSRWSRSSTQTSRGSFEASAAWYRPWAGPAGTSAGKVSAVRRRTIQTPCVTPSRRRGAGDGDAGEVQRGDTESTRRPSRKRCATSSRSRWLRRGHAPEDPVEQASGMSSDELQRLLLNMEEEMRLLAEELRFEEAAQLRDQIREDQRGASAR